MVSGIECFLSIKLCFSLEKQIAVTELGPTFVLASALCGFATSTSFLIVAQLLQGVGAAFFLPSSLTLLTQSFPDPSCALALREVPFRRSPEP